MNILLWVECSWKHRNWQNHLVSDWELFTARDKQKTCFFFYFSLIRSWTLMPFLRLSPGVCQKKTIAYERQVRNKMISVYSFFPSPRAFLPHFYHTYVTLPCVFLFFFFFTKAFVFVTLILRVPKMYRAIAISKFVFFSPSTAIETKKWRKKKLGEAGAKKCGS